MTEIFKDIVQACPNIKAVVIHGEEPHKVIVKNGGFIPLEMIFNKTQNVAHGSRLSNNFYHSCEWIIYTDVVVETVTKTQYLWSPQRIETRFYLSQLVTQLKKGRHESKSRRME